MIDKEQIAIMIRDIDRYLLDLSEMPIKNKNDLKQKEAYYAVSMVIFAVMNRVIDVGNEIISGSADIPVPATYKDTFEILSKHKVISPSVSKEMTSLMKYRNIIAHEYYRLSVDEVFKLKKEVNKAEKFVNEIKKFLKA